jgi:hypothetical protein
LWEALTEHRGVAGRDALWGHPDLLPTDDDFADPAAFAQAQLSLSDLGDFDADLRRLTEGEAAEGEGGAPKKDGDD